MARKLTARQNAFVQEYLIDLNATQAAIRAGYAKKRADQIGWENLRKPEIQQSINLAVSEREKRTEITQDYVLSNLKLISDRNIEKKADVVALKSLELLGKHLGMFTNNHHIIIEEKAPDEMTDEELINIARNGGENSLEKTTGP